MSGVVSIPFTMALPFVHPLKGAYVEATFPCVSLPACVRVRLLQVNGKKIRLCIGKLPAGAGPFTVSDPSAAPPPPTLSPEGSMSFYCFVILHIEMEMGARTMFFWVRAMSKHFVFRRQEPRDCVFPSRFVLDLILSLS